MRKGFCYRSASYIKQVNILVNIDHLVAPLQNGDRRAFSEMVNACQSLVYSTVFNVVLQAEEAEDVSQEVFVQAFLSIGSFRGDAKLSTWLYRIAFTKALEHNRRKKARKRWAFLQPLQHAQVEHVPTTLDHPGVALDKKEDARLLFEALAKLPEQQQAAFLMIKVQSMTYAEAAEVLQTGIKAVEGLMHRAKANLRQYLQHKIDDHPTNAT